MSVNLGQSIGIQFNTQTIGGAATDADSLPTGVLVRNGDDTAEVVTISNVATGVYKASFTVPSTWALLDIVALRVEATVAAVAGKAIVWEETVERPRPSGAGSAEVVLTIKNDLGSAIADAEVWVSRDSSGDDIAAGVAETDSSGQVTFYLDAGTYYRFAQKTGQNFTNPQSFTVT